MFSLPGTHRTVQIKGTRAATTPATPTQQVRARMHVDAIIERLVALGYAEAALRVFFSHDPETLLAVRFAPTAVFAQTPGPRAGERIAGSSRPTAPMEGIAGIGDKLRSQMLADGLLRNS